MKIKNNLALALIVGLSWIYFVTIFLQVSAQEIGLSLTPIMTMVDIKPGSNVDLIYKITNSADPTNVSFSIQRAEPSDEYGNLKRSTDKSEEIHFLVNKNSIEAAEPILLAKNSTKELNINIAIASDTREGVYIYNILGTSNPSPSKQGTVTSRLSLTLSGTLIISVRKEINNQEKAKIVLFSVLNGFTFPLLPFNTVFVDSDNELRAQLLVQNQGKYPISPSGTVLIKNNSQDITTHSVLPEYILPGSNRVLKTYQFGKILSKNGDSIVSIPNGVGPGTITANILLANGSVITSSVRFIAIPYLYIKSFIIIFIITISVFLIRIKK